MSTSETVALATFRCIDHCQRMCTFGLYDVKGAPAPSLSRPSRRELIHGR